MSKEKFANMDESEKLNFTLESINSCMHILNSLAPAQAGWGDKKGACVYLNISNNTLDKWMQDYRSFPAHRVGGCLRFNKNELDVWMSAQRDFR